MMTDCWENVRYRGPDHPIVAAFVAPKLQYLKDRVRLGTSAKILDMGCGTGVFTHYLSGFGCTVGSDLSRIMLGRNPHPRLVQCDAAATPFRSGQFDMVFEANLLHHVEEPVKILQEMARVSRRFVVTLEPNMWNPFMFMNCLLIPHERKALRFTGGFMRRRLAAAGLRVTAQACMGMIFQNKTPALLLPVLKRLDRAAPWGGYILSIAEKRS